MVWQYGLCGAYLVTVLLSCALWSELVGWGCVPILRGTSVYCGMYL